MIFFRYSGFPWIRSFQICNEEEGGNQLNLDITNYFYEYTNRVVLPDVLESHRNVCSCVNVPKYVQQMGVWSINNHHNDMLAYFKPNCSEKNTGSKFIAAGGAYDSNAVMHHSRVDDEAKVYLKIQSFGPDPNSAYFLASCTHDLSKTRMLVTSGSADNFETTTESEKHAYGNQIGRTQTVTNKGGRVQKSFLKYFCLIIIYLTEHIVVIRQ